MTKFEINQNSVFFIINVNAILTLQLSPHAGQSELQSQNRVDVCYGKTFGMGA